MDNIYITGKKTVDVEIAVSPRQLITALKQYYGFDGATRLHAGDIVGDEKVEKDCIVMLDVHPWDDSKCKISCTITDTPMGVALYDSFIEFEKRARFIENHPSLLEMDTFKFPIGTKVKLCTADPNIRGKDYTVASLPWIEGFEEMIRLEEMEDPVPLRKLVLREDAEK